MDHERFDDLTCVLASDVAPARISLGVVAERGPAGYSEAELAALAWLVEAATVSPPTLWHAVAT